MAQEGERAVCVLHSIGKSGVLAASPFEQVGNRIHVTGKITGLAPGKHGFHVHQYGDLTDTAKGRIGRRSLESRRTCPTALRTRKERHVGDLGNVEANAEGTWPPLTNTIGCSSCTAAIRSSAAPSSSTKKPDTFVQPTGAAGGRVAFGVIGWAKPDEVGATVRGERG